MTGELKQPFIHLIFNVQKISSMSLSAQKTFAQASVNR